VKCWAAPLTAVLPALLAASADAATAYVSDELVLGVYSGENSQGQRLTTLHSGANVETLHVNGEFTQVRLNDGTTGWVKSAYLTTRVPATVRLKQLEEELDLSHATTPVLAEAAARSEVEQLKRALTTLQSELDSARRGTAAPTAPAAVPSPVSAPPTAPGTAAVPSAAPSPAPPASASAAPAAAMSMRSWIGVAAMLAAALACGYWLGYATLARRVKQKFGGIKVY